MFSWLFGRKVVEKTESVEEQKPKKRVVRHHQNQVRNYTAAKTNELTAAWPTSSGNIDQILTAQLPAIRERSRYEYRNNSYMSRYIQLAKVNVIGAKGVVLQVHCMNSDGSIDRDACDAIEKAYKKWCRKENCDYQRRLNFVDMQKLLIGTEQMDGEFVVQKVVDPSQKFAFSLLIRQVESLDIRLNQVLKNGNRIRLGVEFDVNGRFLAYWFLRSDQRHDRVSAEKIIHCFQSEFVEQVRGVPATASSLMRMTMQNGFDEAALVNARAGATKMGFIIDPESDYNEADETTDDGIEIDEANPGDWHRLKYGSDVKSYDPTYPSSEYGEFTKSTLKGIASGLNISYHTLASDLEGVNYTSSRTGELHDRDNWMNIQEWFIENFMTPVFEAWLNSELLYGNIRLSSGTPLPYSKFDKFNAPVWQPKRWQWVDPLKQMSAHEKAINNTVRSRSEVIRESGRDPDEVWQEIQREKELLEKLGIAGYFQPDFSLNGDENEQEKD